MKQEEKQLLLKDLCARLPYHPIVYVDKNLPRLKLGVATRVWEYVAVDKPCKPYLRPMSSMTEEEREYYNNHLSGIIAGIDAANFMIWIYSNHLDIFHLIEKSLAIEVTKENNPYK